MGQGKAGLTHRARHPARCSRTRARGRAAISARDTQLAVSRHLTPPCHREKLQHRSSRQCQSPGYFAQERQIASGGRKRSRILLGTGSRARLVLRHPGQSQGRQPHSPAMPGPWPRGWRLSGRAVTQNSPGQRTHVCRLQHCLHERPQASLLRVRGTGSSCHLRAWLPWAGHGAAGGGGTPLPEPGTVPAESQQTRPCPKRCAERPPPRTPLPPKERRPPRCTPCPRRGVGGLPAH